MPEDPEFKKHAMEVLTALQRDLSSAADDYGFQSHLNSGGITVSLERPAAKLTISVEAGARQVRVSVGPRTYKLDWDIVENTFVHTDTHQTLKSLLEQAISKHVKQDVEL